MKKTILLIAVAVLLTACGKTEIPELTTASPAVTEPLFEITGTQSATAAEQSTTSPTVTEPPSEITGTYEIIQFGGYSWLVLEKSDSAALVLSLEIIEEREYHLTLEEITWEHSAIRQYLNGEFYNSFSSEDQNRIISTNIVNNNNPEYDTVGGSNTNDNIFLLSIDEANNYFTDDSARIAKNAYFAARWWWLRSPGDSGFFAAFVNYSGGVNVGGSIVDDGGGVRPAMWINL
ncbi:MAG: DUF6273 domain-containing protein [Oscillospiraceae bacterium]|nr:DUF6273 domain-containing protein [Oscillospiraceae bacterium]